MDQAEDLKAALRGVRVEGDELSDSEEEEGVAEDDGEGSLGCGRVEPPS